MIRPNSLLLKQYGNAMSRNGRLEVEIERLAHQHGGVYSEMVIWQPMAGLEIYTIGHSNHRWDAFVRQLRLNGVEVLVDVRTMPRSRHAPFASDRKLPGLLSGERMTYVYQGDALGGKPADSSLYDETGRPYYRRMKARPQFQEGIEQLVELAGESTVAIMCAEEDPARCHRTLLIGPALEPLGVTLLHIRGDGSINRTGALDNKRANRDELQGILRLQD